MFIGLFSRIGMGRTLRRATFAAQDPGDGGYICSFCAPDFGRALPRSGFCPCGSGLSFAV